MKKILLVGELNSVLQNLNNCLSKHYKVQICSESVELINGMIKISRPDLVIVCSSETDEINRKIFLELKENFSHINTLVIGTRNEWLQYKEKYELSKFFFLSRPVSVDVIIEKCNEILGVNMTGTDDKEVPVTNKKTILIVDDSAIMLRNTRSLLNDKYVVNVATSGEQAMKAMERKVPDLILLDYEMPGWNGKVTFEKIREVPEYQNIPIIFLTGMADKEHITAVLHLNPAGYILKPIDREKLLSAIEKALG